MWEHHPLLVSFFILGNNYSKTPWEQTHLLFLLSDKWLCSSERSQPWTSSHQGNLANLSKSSLPLDWRWKPYMFLLHWIIYLDSHLWLASCDICVPVTAPRALPGAMEGRMRTRSWLTNINLGVSSLLPPLAVEIFSSWNHFRKLEFVP